MDANLIGLLGFIAVAITLMMMIVVLVMMDTVAVTSEDMETTTTNLPRVEVSDAQIGD